MGLASSPAQFQRCMDTMISGLTGVAAYLDDLIVTGDTPDIHLKNLDCVLKRLKEYGFHIKLEKCEFFKRSVEYLGHIIDKEGKRPSESSVDAIKKLPKPANLSELQAFLGKINYYGRYIPNLADKASALYSLLKKNAQYSWSDGCEKSFQILKKSVIDATKLAHFDDRKPIILATDASQYGIGAVLLQLVDGAEVPIAHASKTLTSAQKRYSQIEKVERETLSSFMG